MRYIYAQKGTIVQAFMEDRPNRRLLAIHGKTRSVNQSIRYYSRCGMRQVTKDFANMAKNHRFIAVMADSGARRYGERFRPL